MTTDASTKGSRRPERRPAGRGNRTHEVHVGGTCELKCQLCDCRHPASNGLERALAEGGARLVLRGAAASRADLAQIVAGARGRGFSDVVVHTNALAAMTPDGAERLAATGATAILVPLFSAAPRVHDRITGRPDALAHTLVGMRAMAKTGVAVEIEAPLLAPRLQDLTSTVDLAHRAVPDLRAARFFISTERVADALAPPPLDVAGPALASAVRRCLELGVRVRLTARDAIPLCTLRSAPDVLSTHHFDPRKVARAPHDALHGDECSRCAVRRQCPGIPAAYHRVHGERGVLAYERRPKELYDQRSEGSPLFTPAHHQAASRATIVVLRPTVHCNQDCSFCSANETSSNIWTDSGPMLRAIARAARRGVERVSFGGGEPTLSRDLVHYVNAAHRLGVPKVEIVTNGVLLDKPERVRTLRDAGLSHAFVSLHAHDERLSQHLTRKVGDHERTVRAVHNLIDVGVETSVNHVITSRNYPYLSQFVEFVREEFEGRLMISFAFITPQFKALEDMSLVPRLSDVVPHLRHALYRSIDIGQETTVGSRQGVPPCFLGEFRGWSDVLDLAPEAASEDAPQKQRGTACDECRYTRQCTGLWRPYVARYGSSELVPVPGAPFSADELDTIRHTPRASRHGGFSKFEGLAELLRDPAAEAAGFAAYQREKGPAAPPLRSLPVVTLGRSRPIRAALAGRGRQAHRLARAAAEIAELSIDVVASPSAPEHGARDFGGCPTVRGLSEALDEIRPEAILIAASTKAHRDLAEIALRSGIPTLLEKPPTRTEAEAEELATLARAHPSTPLLIAHNMLFSPGLDEVLREREASFVSVVRRTTAASPEALPAWSRAALFEALYHLIAIAHDACGGGEIRLQSAQPTGDVAPERVQLGLSLTGGHVDILMEYGAPRDEVVVSRRAAATAPPQLSWHRVGSEATVTRGGSERRVPRDGTDLGGLLRHFCDVVLRGAAPRSPLASGIEVMHAARAAVLALDAAGAPFDRQRGPRHVASPAMVPFPATRREHIR